MKPVYKIQWWEDCDHCFAEYRQEFSSVRDAVQCAETVIRTSPMRILRDGRIYLIKDPFSDNRWRSADGKNFVSETHDFRGVPLRCQERKAYE